MKIRLSLPCTVVLATALVLVACDREDTGTETGACEDVVCGENATCDAETGACVCDDAGLTLVGEDCTDTRMVSCRNVSPSFATPTVVQVEVTWDGESWSEPAPCEWTCNYGLTEHEGECIQSMEVPCDDSDPPENGTAVEGTVVITWDGERWSEPEACDFVCDAGYGPWDGGCHQTREVPCDDSGAPEGAIVVESQVTITWDDEDGWSETEACAWSCEAGLGVWDGGCHAEYDVPCDDSDVPANASAEAVTVTIIWDEEDGWSDIEACAWACDAGYGEWEGACLDSREVDCDDSDTPEGATAEIEPVTIHWDETLQQWTEPEACGWSCSDGYQAGGDGCVANRTITDCALQAPLELEDWIGVPVILRGQVEVDGLTGGADRLSGIRGRLCHGPAPIGDSSVDLEDLECVYAEYEAAVGDSDGYAAEEEFYWPGTVEYVFAFSGDGGESWVVCDRDGLVDGGSQSPGTATLYGPYDGGFELWENVGGDLLLVDWDHGPDVTVEREETRVHSGDYAVRLTRVGTNNEGTEFSSALMPVVPGVEYAIEMWFFDDDETARGRHIYQWHRSDGTEVGNAEYGPYTTDAGEWQLVSVVGTAPAEAAFLRVATRVYGTDPAGQTGGSIYLDTVRVYANE